MKKQKYIAYYRVSTKGQSLGLDAQKRIVKNYLEKSGWPPIASFQEKESGKADHNRPELQKALALCKKERATLIVSSLDRLARNVHFITSLEKSKINFVFADQPNITKLHLHILASVAEHEREMISQRTSRALQELKRKGVKLGSKNPHTLKGLKRRWKTLRLARIKKEQEIKILPKVKKQKEIKLSKTQIADNRILPMLKTFRKQRMSYQKISEAFNSTNVPTRQNGTWTAVQVHRIAQRAGL